MRNSSRCLFRKAHKADGTRTLRLLREEHHSSREHGRQLPGSICCQSGSSHKTQRRCATPELNTTNIHGGPELTAGNFYAIPGHRIAADHPNVTENQSCDSKFPVSERWVVMEQSTKSSLPFMLAPEGQHRHRVQSSITFAIWLGPGSARSIASWSPASLKRLYPRSAATVVLTRSDCAW